MVKLLMNTAARRQATSFNIPLVAAFDAGLVIFPPIRVRVPITQGLAEAAGANEACSVIYKVSTPNEPFDQTQ